MSDRYEFDEDDCEGAIYTGVETLWTYRIEGAAKCQIADPLEGALAAKGWKQHTLETAGPGGVGAIRFSEFYRSSGFVIVNVDAPPTSFNIRIQARRRTADGSTPTAPPTAFLPWPCTPDRPPLPPDKPANRAAALKANQAIYARLPLPAGAEVTAHRDDTATAYGNGNVAIGYGSGWTLQLPPGTDPCASAAAFDAAMAKAGWERFTYDTPAGRQSRYFKPPRSVEATWNQNGTLFIMTMGNGATVGTNQHPDLPSFSAGATPESRGTPVPCRIR